MKKTGVVVSYLICLLLFSCSSGDNNFSNSVVSNESLNGIEKSRGAKSKVSNSKSETETEKTTVNDLFGERSAVKVHPKVVNNFLNVSIWLEQDIDLSIAITELNGTLLIDEVLPLQKGTNTKKVNVSSLDIGMYVVLLKVADEQKEFKIAVSR